MLARWLGPADIYDFFFFFCITKVFLNEKGTNPVPASTMCLKQDKSSSGLAMVSSRAVETAVSTGGMVRWLTHAGLLGHTGELCCSQ